MSQPLDPLPLVPTNPIPPTNPASLVPSNPDPTNPILPTNPVPLTNPIPLINPDPTNPILPTNPVPLINPISSTNPDPTYPILHTNPVALTNPIFPTNPDPTNPIFPINPVLLNPIPPINPLFINFIINPVPDFDPDFEGYQLLPVSDGKQPLYLSADGHVYSRRIEIDPLDKIKRHGFYCAMGRYFVTVNGQQATKEVCCSTPANPCEHIPTDQMHTLHRVIRASKLICCALMDQRRVPPDLRKNTVADILTEVFMAYAPEYPNLDVGQVFEHRSAGWKYIRGQKEAPRTPWAVVRDSKKPILQDEMEKERARGPQFEQAYAALFEKFRVMQGMEDEGDPEPRPELVALLNAARAWAVAEGINPEDIVLHGRGPRGGLRSFKFVIPKE